ncbi:MAG: methylenetetrahydrofolate reductase [Woeseiaceae bacterium]
MTTFRDTIRRKDFVITAELPLHADQSMQDLQGNVAVLQPVVDAVQVGCGEGVDMQIAALAAARIARESGVDAIVHLSSRDRNRIALQNDILGAAALGVTALIPRRGEKLPSSLRGRIKGVFDTKVAQLLTIAQRVGENSSFVEGGLFLGCLVTAFRPQRDWNAERVMEKLDAGAGFLQTRPSLELDLIRDYVSKLVSLRLTHRAAVIIGVPLLTSATAARTIGDRHPGATVLDAVVKRLGEAADPGAEGVRMVADMISELASMPGVTGVAIVDVEDARAAAEAIQLSGVLDQAGSG